MIIATQDLFSELNQLSTQASADVYSFLRLTDEQLNYKKTSESWSILECLEHLNLYGDYYLPEIGKHINSSKEQYAPVFRAGWLGNYFAQSMKGKNGKINKMKSPTDKLPVASALGKQTIHRFIEQMETLQNLLKQAEYKNMNKIRIPISLSKFVRINLGDTFRFYLYHIERHVAQCKRNL